MKDYKKILEGVVDIINTTENSDIGFANICAYIGENCPELKESEDERIRKELIVEVKEQIDCIPAPDCRDEEDEKVLKKLNKWLAWLEKQGEQKPADKIEPKFKVGQTIIYKGTENIAPTKMTISDIAKGQYWDDNCCIVPISDQDNWELVEQKPAWSEEDELHIRELESLVKRIWAVAEHENDKETIHKMSDLSFFLKTLKPQLKQEWSEEDESKRKFIEDELSGLIADEQEIESPLTKRANDLYSALYWLKSLRPQSSWKPSEEQVSVLEFIMEDIEKDSIRYAVLNSVLEQLKKLREE